MRVAETTVKAISKGVGFIRRQPRDWKITVARSSADRFLYQLVFPYISIYTIALGANATQLGIATSAGMGIAGLLSPLNGWLIDRIGIKKIYLIGIGLLAISYMTYGIAHNWIIIIIAMSTYWLGFSTSMNACNTVCGNSLANEDRATGMSFCETLASGLLGVAAPMLGALLITHFGRLNVDGIRPLFFISLAGTAATFILILTRLSDRSWKGVVKANPGLSKGLSQVFEQGRNLKRWIVIASISNLPLGMILPFTQVFAHQFKGADQYTLSAMVSGFALMPLVLGMPFGRLADKIGRKKVLYFTIPLFWASSLLLIWAPSPAFLVTAGILQGFFFICMVTTGAMGFELVPPEHMGRWMGIMRLFRMLVTAGGAYLAGIIWDNLGPQYLFLIYIGIDILIRIPLLIGMPETLKLKNNTEI
ncbi:MFS transporter [Chloroflexota bacterium]